MRIIGTTHVKKIYTHKVSIDMLIADICEYVWLTKKARLVVAYAKAKEHAYWLVGDEAEHQAQN